VRGKLRVEIAMVMVRVAVICNFQEDKINGKYSKYAEHKNIQTHTRLFSGRSMSDCNSVPFKESNSSSMMAVSMTNRKMGGREVLASTMYSIVVNCGRISACVRVCVRVCVCVCVYVQE
jgi:hypothetical protein